MCVHVLQITTVSLSVKLSFLYFSLCSPSSPPPPALPGTSEIIYRVYTWTAFACARARVHSRIVSLARGDRVSPAPLPPKKNSTAKKWRNKRREKNDRRRKERKVDPRRPINIFIAIIYIRVAFPSLPPSPPLPSPPLLYLGVVSLFLFFRIPFSLFSIHFITEDAKILVLLALSTVFYNWHCVPFSSLSVYVRF